MPNENDRSRSSHKCMARYRQPRRRGAVDFLSARGASYRDAGLCPASPGGSTTIRCFPGRRRVPGRPHAVSRAGDVTLNFAGADIRDVIAEVLGKTLQLNYVVDPEVAGPVTFNVSRPLARDELLPTLEAVLNSHGATMVQADGIIRIVPLPK